MFISYTFGDANSSRSQFNYLYGKVSMEVINLPLYDHLETFLSFIPQGELETSVTFHQSLSSFVSLEGLCSKSSNKIVVEVGEDYSSAWESKCMYFNDFSAKLA